MLKLSLLFSVLFAGVGVTSVGLETDYTKQIDTWRAQRLQRLQAPNGWLSLIGLPWLKPGSNTVGSAKDNDVVLVKGPAHLGKVVWKDGKVTVMLDAAAQAQIDGKSIATAELLDDSHEKPTTVSFGTASFYLIDRSGRKGLRVKDSEAETRTHFLGLDNYPTDPSWRVEAKWTAFDPPHQLEVPSVIGTIDKMPVPGKATFERDGHSYELLPVLEEPDANELWFIIADRTSGKETYGSARFLYAEMPKDGKIVIDFNKAYNPPCAFTPYATCPLAPPENRLALAVTAGEKNTVARITKPDQSASPEASPQTQSHVRSPRRQKARHIRFGDRTVITHGRPRYFWSDFFHECLTLRWPTFFGLIALLFLAMNTVFAFLYGLGDQPIANQAPAGFWGAFFFSVETLATVGYGDMHPQSLYGHMLATVEIFVGMMSIAVVTGLVFSRFSRPRAKIMFSHHPVIGPVDGKLTLMIRAANARQNVISEASATLRMVRREISAEGVPMRRLHDMKLTRDHHPIFSLGWNLMHVIDEQSPLHGMSSESLEESDADLILIIEGIDETTVQPMRARMNYNHAQIRWQHRYVDIATIDEAGVTHMDYTRFQDITPL